MKGEKYRQEEGADVDNMKGKDLDICLGLTGDAHAAMQSNLPPDGPWATYVLHIARFVLVLAWVPRGEHICTLQEGLHPLEPRSIYCTWGTRDLLYLQEIPL